MSDEAMPKQIDRYEILRELGAGAMGSVYEARHKGTGRRVAIKVIKPEAAQGPGGIQRFQREARAAGAIASEHITQVLDSGTDPETHSPFLVMELLNGEDLHVVASRFCPMRPELALRIVAQALRGLDRAHAANVIHRDIKPPNMFLAKRDGGDYVVKLCDFGIAKVGPDALTSSQNAALTHTSALLGSPIYMSPEQAKGAKKIDSRSDLWSMGVVLYELLVGNHPYPEADTLGLILLAICSHPPADVQKHAPWVSLEVEAIVKRAMTTDLTKRYQSAREMLEDILHVLPEGVTTIDAAMLTPMNEQELTHAAEMRAKVDSMPYEATVDASSDGSLPGGVAALAISSPNAGLSSANTNDPRTETSNAYARSRNESPGRSRRSIAIVGALSVALVGGGAAIYAARGHGATAAPITATTGESSPSASAGANFGVPSSEAAIVPAPLAPLKRDEPAASASAAASAAPSSIAQSKSATHSTGTHASGPASSASAATKKSTAAPTPPPTSSSQISRDFN